MQYVAIVLAAVGCGLWIRATAYVLSQFTALREADSALQRRVDAFQSSVDERLGALGQQLLETEVDLSELEETMVHDVELLARAHNSVAVRVLQPQSASFVVSNTKKDLPS